MRSLPLTIWQACASGIGNRRRNSMALNAALNAQAALSQVRERQLASNLQTNHNGTPPSVPSPSATSIQPRPEHCEGAASGLRALPPVLINPAPAPAPSSTVPASVPQVPAPIPVVASPSPSHIGPFPNALESAEDALLQKLQWATRELQHATSIESSVQLCNLIRSCAESLRSIKELQL
ncbi:UNVERIFIED_CONTAM: hypothetical protein FKN15_045691 [Acipenser sinensis]